MDKEDIQKEVDEELELLSSMFSLNGESCNLMARVPHMLIEVTQRAKSDQPSRMFKLTFELKDDYPSNAPYVSIDTTENAMFTRNESKHIASELTLHATTLQGNFCLCPNFSPYNHWTL